MFAFLESFFIINPFLLMIYYLSSRGFLEFKISLRSRSRSERASERAFLLYLESRKQKRWPGGRIVGFKWKYRATFKDRISKEASLEKHLLTDQVRKVGEKQKQIFKPDGNSRWWNSSLVKNFLQHFIIDICEIMLNDMPGMFIERWDETQHVWQLLLRLGIYFFFYTWAP